MRGIINIFNHQHLLVCVHAPRSLRDKINTEKPPSRVLRECAADRNLCWFCGFILEDIGTVKMDPKFVYLRPRFVDKFHSARVSSRPHHNHKRRDEKTCCGRHRSQHMQGQPPQSQRPKKFMEVWFNRWQPAPVATPCTPAFVAPAALVLVPHRLLFHNFTRRSFRV